MANVFEYNNRNKIVFEENFDIVPEHRYPNLVNFCFSTLPNSNFLNSSRLRLKFDIYFGEHSQEIQGQEFFFVLVSGNLNFRITNGEFVLANQQSPLSPHFNNEQIIVSNSNDLGVSFIFYKEKTPIIEYLKGTYNIAHLGDITRRNSCSLQATFKVNILQDIKIINIDIIYPSRNKKEKRTIEQMIKKEFFQTNDEYTYLLSEILLSL